MFKRILMVIFVLSASLSGLFLRNADIQAQELVDFPVVPLPAQLDASMVLFTLYGQEQIVRDETNPEVERITRAQSMSLGTVINADAQPLIVTHGHWSLDSQQWAEVGFMNADGVELLRLTMAVFVKLLVHQDKGTMVLELPASLHGSFAPAPFSESPQLKIGAEVVIVRRVNLTNQLASMRAKIGAVAFYQGQPTLTLLSLDGMPIIPGDSGGGVFLNGQLIANNWTSIIEESTQSDSVFGITIATRTTEVRDKSRAALFTSLIAEQLSVRTVDSMAPAGTTDGPG